MSNLHGCPLRLPEARFVPPSGTDDSLRVRIHRRGRAPGHRIPTRAPSSEAAVIEPIGTGLEDDSWTGLLYLMEL